jgi:hypothetical protein
MASAFDAEQRRLPRSTFGGLGIDAGAIIVAKARDLYLAAAFGFARCCRN